MPKSSSVVHPRALTHYESKVIEEMTECRTFNIGRNGSPTDMQLAFLKAYLKNNSKPKLIIHNLDLYSFQTSNEIYDPAQYMHYLDQAPIYEALRQVYPDAWKWKYLLLYGYVAEDVRFMAPWIEGTGRAPTTGGPCPALRSAIYPMDRRLREVSPQGIRARS